MPAIGLGQHKAFSKGQSITLTVPDSIGGFSLADRETYENPALGYRLRYVGSDSMYTDLYVYPGPAMATSCDTAAAIRVAEAKVAGFREAFPGMIERHYVDSIAVTRDDQLHPDVAVPWCAARHLTLEVIREGRLEHSDFYLCVLSGYFVKVRITYPFTNNRLVLEQAFISDVFARLLPK